VPTNCVNWQSLGPKTCFSTKGAWTTIFVYIYIYDHLCNYTKLYKWSTWNTHSITYRKSMHRDSWVELPGFRHTPPRWTFGTWWLRWRAWQSGVEKNRSWLFLKCRYSHIVYLSMYPLKVYRFLVSALKIIIDQNVLPCCHCLPIFLCSDHGCTSFLPVKPAAVVTRFEPLNLPLLIGYYKGLYLSPSLGLYSKGCFAKLFQFTFF